MDYDKMNKWLDLALKAEVHAFALVLIGAGLYLHGAKEIGAGAFSAGLSVFKGNR
jgi:hypothetical protein